MKTFTKIFNILFPAFLLLFVINGLRENLQKAQPDGQAIFLQVLLLVFGAGLIVYRLIRFNKPSGDAPANGE
jgi:hypothetical protein